MKTNNAAKCLRLLSLSLLLAFAPEFQAAGPARKPQQLTSPQQVPKGLTKSDWASIRAAYQAGRHAFTPVAGGWQARNPGQQWLTKFDGRGFLAEPSGGGWKWGLELKSYGFPGRDRAASGVPTVKAERQRLTYGWDAALEEWFVNDARGLEHGFTVRERPVAGREAGAPLQFDLAVRGSLVAQVEADGQGVLFRDVTGITVLNYTGLKVWDADGKVLSARFAPTLASATGVLRLVVEERGARYPITVDPLAQQTFLKASNTGAGDLFGTAVAISGDTVVVGAYAESGSGTGVDPPDDNLAPFAGAAYVFVRTGTTWTQQAYLKASNTGGGDGFGLSVAVSGDTVVVGAPFEYGSGTGVNPPDDNLAPEAGAAYVFVRSGTTWSQEAYLKASNPGSVDRFGDRVAISGDTVVVGAYLESGSGTGVNPPDDNLATQAGAAYVFVRTGTTWSQQAYLKASNTEAKDLFGSWVAVSGDTVVVGAPGEDGSGTGVNPSDNNLTTDAGAVYVFVRTGTSWSQQAYLKASASHIGIGAGFGACVAVSGDTVVVGAPADNSLPTGSGAGYVFVRSGTTWSQQAYLKTSNAGAGDSFGVNFSVAVDGDTVVVGTYAEDGSGTGVNPPDDNIASAAGAAYIFVRSGTSWSQQAYLKASNTGAGDQFGTAVAVSGDTVVVGAPNEDGSGIGVNPADNNLAADAGAAYVFAVSTETPLAITCPLALSVQCTANVPLAATDQAPFEAQGGAVSGGCSPLTVGFVSESSFGTCPRIITRTYRVSDSCGNHSDCTQTITVRDTTAPAVTTATGSLDRTVECSDQAGLAAALALAPAATDNCTASPTIHLRSDVTTSGSCASAYVRTREWNFTDTCGNPSSTFTQTISVRDMTVPTVTTATGSLDRTVECGDQQGFAAALALVPAATDNCTASPTIHLRSDVTTAGSCANALIRVRQWNFTDACGNFSAIFRQTITMQDTTAPAVTTAAGSLDRTLECSDATGIAAALALVPSAKDNCTASPTIHVVSDVTTVGSCPNAGVRVRQWNFTDACGNPSATFTQTITVRDTTAPAVTTAAGSLDRTLECSDAAGIAGALALAPSATDNCPASPTIHLVSTMTTAGSCASAYVRVRQWNFTDACGNTSATFTQTITVQDTTAPAVTTAAGSLDRTLESSDAAGIAAALALVPSATDNCTANPTIHLLSDVTTAGSSANAYVRVRQWNFTDACGNTSATFTQTITVQDTPPIAVSDSVTTDEDTSVNIPVLANDSDPNGDALTVSSFTQGANGSVTLNSDNTLNYTPSLNFNGTDSFNYTVSDAALTAVGTVVVSVTAVNDAPIAADDSVTTDEDTPVTLNVLSNDRDVDGDALAVSSVTQGAHGTVVLNADGSVTYQPEANFNGSDLFSYTVSDGQSGRSTATVAISVRPLNDPPIASDGTATSPEDTPLAILLVASDIDGDSLSFSIVTQPEHGTLGALNNNQVSYTPDLNYTGPDSLTFRASDGQTSGDGVVRITVGPVNDPPILDPVDDQTASEGTTLALHLSATDPDGDSLVFGSPNLPSGAALNPTTGDFSWTPSFAQAGEYSVTFTVADPSGGQDSKTIAIHVLDIPHNVNQDPDCSHAFASIQEIWPPNHKQAMVIEILGVTDPDGDQATITITGIQQDEPTNTLGDGETWVDGGGVGTGRAWVRAERSGTPRVPGNGRVYEIFFTASDGHGGLCTGSVKIGVPHDQDHRPAIDDGVRYDSTVPGGPRLN